MNPQFRKVALIAASLGLLVSLFFALRSGEDEAATVGTTGGTTRGPIVRPPATTIESPPTTAPPGPARFAIEAGGEIERGSVEQGRKVLIVVRSDVADHAHLHGYDIVRDLVPGKPAQIEFTASIPGQFEIELEERHQLIGVLEVRP